MNNEAQVFSDRYELVRHIARGGMAQVYLARDLLLDRQVALKVLFPELSVDPSFVERFRAEAKAAANLSHPNIVAVYDWGQGERTYFIVMEFVDGSTLSSEIRGGGLTIRRAAEVGTDVAAALAFAHRRGVIHRDVKPGNVLIDTSGQVKVADFGIARAVGAKEGLTQTGAVMGTATYFSPEQAQGLPVDARSDVYSLGVVLFEMAAGRPPFSGDNPVTIAYKHVREPAPPLASLRSDVPRPYAAVVAKAMAKEPADRYQSASDLRADLHRFLAGQPVSAADPVAGAADTVVGAAVGPGVAPTTATRAATVVGAAVGAAEVGRLERDRQRDAALAAADADRARSRRSAAVIAAMVAVLLLAAAIVAALALTRGSGTASKAIPGDLVGQPLAKDQAELRQLGFTHVGTATVQSSLAAGLVAATNPAAGTPTPLSDLVTLRVSSGPAPVAVPDVTGQPQAAATATLQAAGLKVATAAPQPSATVPSGSVISTDPPAGTSAPTGSTVTLTVSSGQQQVTIPNLTGQDGSTAGNKLGQLGLSVTTRYEASTKVQPGKVTRTDPAAGTPVPVGQTIVLYVSQGTTAPNVVGQAQQDAIAAVQAAGLNPTVQGQAVTDPSQDGVVQAESPAGGTGGLAPGSTVTLTVGHYTAPSTTTSSSTTSTTTTVPTSSTTSSSVTSPTTARTTTVP